MKLLSICLFFISLNAYSNQVFVDGKEFLSLQEAKSSIKDGSLIYIKAGIYTEGIYIKANNIEIIGEDNVIFDDAAVNGKAALVLTGDNVLVESIECRNMHVRDKNGACIRFEGKNLTLRDIYAHDSQSGVMTSRNNGFVNIEHSRFERLGGKGTGRGYAHGVYIKAKSLYIKNSIFLSTKGEGTAVKSRSESTIIEDSIIASLEAKDSRLVDVSNKGELIIRNSILQQGNNSSNSQLIGYGLEGVESEYKKNRIDIRDNLFLLDRENANVIIKYRNLSEKNVQIINNFLIGDFLYTDKYIENNSWYFSRKKAKIKPLPYLPNISELPNLINAISIVGELN